FQRLDGPPIRKTQIERRLAHGGNDIRCRVAHVNGGDFKVGRWKPRRTLVPDRALQSLKVFDKARERVLRAVRIGDMTLLSFDGQPACQGAAPPDLYFLSD